MQNNLLKLEIEFQVSASELYKIWFNNEKQKLITGKIASISNREGSRYFIQDGFAFGEIIRLVNNKQILKSWRTLDFSDEMEDCDVEIDFEQTTKGCKIILNQFNIPKELIASCKEFWINNYFSPMQNYFQNLN